MKNKLMGGSSVDAILLTFIKLVTTGLGLIITRLLSQYLSVHDYGTYSQILLIVSTVSSVTILGMMDGMNFFYCSERDPEKREAYTATIFAMQCIVGAVAGCIVMLLSAPLCKYFDNPDVKNLLIFAAVLPVLQNLLGIFQILLVSVGKARVLALRNFIVSLVRLAAVFLVVMVVRNVAVVLAATVLLDLGQILFFGVILKKSDCRISMKKVNFGLLRRILAYCAPMAVFAMVNSLNRDMDKYLISMMTDTETLAVYTNASKTLPFDIVMSSFCTVLIPSITRLISQNEKRKAAELYRRFLEIAYITTGILCFAALSAAPQLMTLLYSDKYASGIAVFCLYILVDLFRFTNITLVLSAAGKTRTLMLLGLGTLGCNAILNVLLYRLMGITGPAAATLISTVLLGVLMLALSAKELGSRLRNIFDAKYLLLFTAENLVLTFFMSMVQKKLADLGMHYFVILVAVCGAYGIIMLLLNGKRLFRVLRMVNKPATTDDRG